MILKRFLLLIPSLLGIFLASVLWAKSLPSEFSGKVVGVTDGDSLTVLVQQKPLKIRLSGIDCPEKKQPFGAKAKKFTSENAYGKEVQILHSGKDRYGRSLGVVILPDGRNLNHELLKSGLAWHYKQYSKDEVLAGLEQDAREFELGLWGDAQPTPPWEFRRAKRKSKTQKTRVTPQSKSNYFQPVNQSCCKVCRKGKACGDTCISRNYTCRKPPGCACNG